MTLRSCIFKGCENYICLTNKALNKVTLFGFPKNPARRQKWIELGQVPPNINESNYYFCSDHFDKKFLAINNRRTILVGEALPFPYVETEIDETNRDEETELNYLMYDLDRGNTVERQQYSNDQDILVESTTITSEIQGNSGDQFLKPEPEEYIVFSDDESNKDPTECIVIKRKSENAFMLGNSSKIIKTSQAQKPVENLCMKITPSNLNMKTNSNETPMFSNKERSEDINLDELVDAKHVTTFIFKCEEYVQMPKEHYIREKIELMKKLRKMERTLQAIKGHLSTLDV